MAVTERLAELLHEEWLVLKAEQGYHSADYHRGYALAGGPQWDGSRCSKCRDDLVPWADLSEPVKEVNRRGVRRFLKEVGLPERMQKGAVGKAVEQLADARNLRTTSMMTEVQERIARALRFLGVEVDGGRRGGDAR